MNKVVKLLIIILGLIILLPGKMYASSIDINEVTLDSKSDGVTILSDPEIDDLDINLNLKFSEIGDFVRYKIDIKNNDKEDYTLNVKNDLDNFDYDITKKTIRAKTTTSIYVKITLRENISSVTTFS